MSRISEMWRTSPAELRAHFGGWREPLSSPRATCRPNPFTGALTETESWDPTPDVAVKDASEVDIPFEKIDALLDDEGLTVLCAAISRASDGPTVRLRPALIGPTTDRGSSQSLRK